MKKTRIQLEPMSYAVTEEFKTLRTNVLFCGDDLRSLYDYIIIDSAPLGMVVDGAIVAEHSDGAIMVLESGAIKYRLAQNVKTSLENAGCPVLGVVLNKVDRKATGHYYSRFYGKYYGKNYGKYYGEMTGNKGISDENFTRQIKENLK